VATHVGERPDGARITTIGAAGLAALLVVHIGFGLNDAAFAARDGIWLNTPTRTESQLAATTADALAADALDNGDAQLFTNDVPGMWAGTGRLTLHWSPRRTTLRGVALEGDLERFVTDVACSPQPALLALYDDGSPNTYNADEISPSVQLTTIATTDDGTLYRVTPLEGTSAPDCPTA
jgi:hypothetical protein